MDDRNGNELQSEILQEKNEKPVEGLDSFEEKGEETDSSQCEIDDVKMQTDTASNCISETQKENDKAESIQLQNDELQSDITALKEELSACKQKHQYMEDELSSLRSIGEGSKESARKLEEECSKLASRVEQQKVTEENLLIRIADLEKTISERTCEVQFLENSKAELEKDLVEVKRNMEEKLKHQQKIYDQEVKIREENIASVSSIQAQLSSSQNQVIKLEKELEEAKSFEAQLIKETDKLHGEVESLKKQKQEIVRASEKRTSDASELSRDINILTLERDDLLSRMESLRLELSKTKEEKNVLEEEHRDLISSTSTVCGNTELMKMKQKFAELETKNDEQQRLIEILQLEKEKLSNGREELDTEISKLRKDVLDITQEKDIITSSKESIESALSDAKKSLELSESQMEKLETTSADLRTQAKKRDDAIAHHKHELKETKATYKREIQDLKKELKSAANLKTSELKKLEQIHNGLLADLHLQIETQKSENERLQRNLDAVQLRAINPVVPIVKMEPDSSHFQQDHLEAPNLPDVSVPVSKSPVKRGRGANRGAVGAKQRIARKQKSTQRPPTPFSQSPVGEIPPTTTKKRSTGKSENQSSLSVTDLNCEDEAPSPRKSRRTAKHSGVETPSVNAIQAVESMQDVDEVVAPKRKGSSRPSKKKTKKSKDSEIQATNKEETDKSELIIAELNAATPAPIQITDTPPAPVTSKPRKKKGVRVRALKSATENAQFNESEVCEIPARTSRRLRSRK